MPTFRYRAYDDRGELVEGTVEAVSEEAADASIWSQGLISLEVHAASQSDIPWWRRDLFASTAIKQPALAAFTRELSELFSSGIPVDSCLRILSDEATTQSSRQLSTSLLKGVVEGHSLADSMKTMDLVFSQEYLSVVHAGEASGTLSQSLNELAKLMERRAEVNARVRAALTYPLILVGMAIVSIGVIVGVLVPSMAPIFVESGKPMPDTLRVLVWLQESWVMIAFACVAVLGGAIGARAYIRTSSERRIFIDGWKLRIRVGGTFIVYKDTARFVRTLGTLLRAGVPMLQAAVAAQATVRNQAIAVRLDRAIHSIREGNPLSAGLRAEQIFPQLLIRMISVGEETAKLDRMLLRAAEMFEERTQRSIDRALTLLTPALTLIVAVLVGGLVLSVMGAVLSINDLAAG